MDDQLSEATSGSLVGPTGHSATAAMPEKDDTEKEVTGRIGLQMPRHILPSADLLEKLAAYSLTLWGTRDGELQRFACQLAGTGGGRGATSRSPSDAHDTDVEGATCRPIIVPFKDETILRCLLHATRQFDLLYQALEKDENEDEHENEEKKRCVFYWWRDAAGKTMRRDGPWAFGRAREKKSRLREPDLATWITERRTDDQKPEQTVVFATVEALLTCKRLCTFGEPQAYEATYREYLPVPQQLMLQNGDIE
ncbi:hypothetical protein CMEL01_16799 [Colletotrichum melonis]|uniref:Uncharacterized protein n=1 Tax=Colletotrichum melonis TaxID=1209925 RepID=A0AAI9XIP2_9PEZI|nr:hypothetical protein CMEL01_16799 [Colletotrichum melonis]